MTIKDRFANLETKHDVAALLNISVEELNYIYGGRLISSYYCQFELPKKKGGFRTINYPTGRLRYLLNKLSIILTELYDETTYYNNISHGYIRNKSIKTNAEVHFGNPFLLNIDLKDFFDTITYSRIKGLFIKGFNVGQKAANVLSLFICYKGVLPQGSPCSPVISNMICKRLDKELYQFGSLHKLKITRYVDDISISAKDQYTFSKVFENNEITTKFENIITNNGFTINEDKIRASYTNQKKEVTGLIINEKINVPRKYVRNLRSQIHNAKCFSDSQKNQVFDELYGRVSYIRHIKSKNDPIFIKYALEFNNLYNYKYFQVDEETLDYKQYIFNRVLLIARDVKIENTILKHSGNGTGFYLKYDENYYIVTCYHVIKNELKNFLSFGFYSIKREKMEEVFNFSFSKDSDRIDEFRKYSEDDIVLLRLDYKPEYFFEIEDNLEDSSIISSEVKAIGFPEYVFNSIKPDQASIIDMSISAEKMTTYNTSDKSISIVGVNVNIPHGVSGGPVINKENKVIGIASNGTSYDDLSRGKFYKPGFISAQRIKDILNNKNEINY